MTTRTSELIATKRQMRCQASLMNRPALSERSESKGESKGPLRWSASGIP